MAILLDLPDRKSTRGSKQSEQCPWIIDVDYLTTEVEEVSHDDNAWRPDLLLQPCVVVPSCPKCGRVIFFQASRDLSPNGLSENSSVVKIEERYHRARTSQLGKDSVIETASRNQCGELFIRISGLIRASI